MLTLLLKVGQVKEIYEMKGAGRSIRGNAGTSFLYSSL